MPVLVTELKYINTSSELCKVNENIASGLQHFKLFFTGKIKDDQVAGRWRGVPVLNADE